MAFGRLPFQGALTSVVEAFPATIGDFPELDSRVSLRTTPWNRSSRATETLPGFPRVSRQRERLAPDGVPCSGPSETSNHGRPSPRPEASRHRRAQRFLRECFHECRSSSRL